MKIALCSSIVPFTDGGYRNIVEWLKIELLAAGHRVEVVNLPHVDAPDSLISQMAAYGWVDLSASADRVICFRPPAHVIPHPHKILWFIHHIRAFYDLWDSPYRGFADDDKHRAIRDVLHRTDTAAFKEAKKIFANSQVVSDRLSRFNGVGSEVLYPPLFQPERFECKDFNDEIVCIARVEHHKRQHLLIEAMRHTRSPVKLRLCGVSGGSGYVLQLKKAIASRGLQNRVHFENEWISEQRKVDLLSQCLAAAYIPLDEDSYGYPSLEASHSSKPILATVDSGGVCELVEHGVNGLIAEPDPKALAEAMDRLYLDRKGTQKMGLNAASRVGEMNISWSHVLERLLT